MKLLISLIACLTIIACSPSVQQPLYPMPDELEGCKVFELYPGNGGSSIMVVKCPTLDCMSTSYKSGKSNSYTSICQ